MNSLYSIDKLDDKNYDAWCIQMRSVLVHASLWNVVIGKLTRSDATSVDEWDSLDEKALATLILSVKASQLNHIKVCKTSADAWKKLEEIYRPTGPVRKVSLYKKLLNMRMAENEEMSVFVNEFSNSVDKLAEVGIAIQDELVVIILLSSLPKSFEQFVVAMETRDSLPEFQVLKVKLLEEADRKNQCTSREHNSESHAYIARAKQFKSGENYAKTNKKGKQNFKCFNCGQRGHFAANCRQNSNKREQNNKSERQYTVLAAADANVLNKERWCLDSGATAHMCCNKSFFVELREHRENIYLAGEHFITAEGKGEVKIETDGCMLILRNVLYVPTMNGNFVSVNSLCENGYVVTFENNNANISNKNGVTMFNVRKEQKLYVLYSKFEKCYKAKNNENVMTWHKRFGHLNFRSLQQLATNNMVDGMNEINNVRDIQCKVCMKTKIHVKPFEKSETRSKEILDIIHTDVCGPFDKNSLGGARYFLTFIDDKSRRMYVYFLKHKDEVLAKFKSFKEMVECQTSKRIKTLRSDNGREFVNKEFDAYLESNGILRELTVPYTPQQNGVAERANRTIVEMARAMLLQSGLSDSLWAEAVATAVYIRNRSPTKILESITPFEAFTGRKPNVKHFRIFGSEAVGLDKTTRRKFHPKGKEYKMVGYSLTAKAYRLYDSEKRIVVEKRDVLFVEDRADGDLLDVSDLLNVPQQSVICSDSSDEEEFLGFDDDIDESSSNIEELNEAVAEVQYGAIIKEEQTSKKEKINRKNCVEKLNSMTNCQIQVPLSVNEAVTGDHSAEWVQSMKKEYSALIANKTWTLVEQPDNQKVIGCKWVFSVKRNKCGDVEKFKSRLVAKGCSQQFGVNYTETFSPVIRYETIRMVIALAAEMKMYLHQMDVCTAYLNSDLTDEVYMKQPEMFVSKKNPNHVLKLNKAIYGLKQAGREWNLKLDNVLRQIGFTPCVNDPCLYKVELDGQLAIVAVYVDDLIVGSPDLKTMKRIKEYISDSFECVDKGPLNHFLGMRIERDGDLGMITVDQSQFIRELLKHHNMENCRPASTPLDRSFSVACFDEKCEKIDPTRYQSSIGSLMHLAICTRPDIIHSVTKLAQRNKNPHKEHEAGIKHILRYLLKTVDLKLVYRQTGKLVEGYADADWGSEASDRKSYSGYVFFLGGSAFSWGSQRQKCVALSSTEAEYVALTVATKEAVYLKSLLGELGVQDEELPVTVYGDNLSAQQLVKNPVYHSRIAVNLTSNKSAVGVGYMPRSSEDLYMSGGHGVAVKILHLFGDKLWGHEPQLAQQIPQFKSTKLTEDDFPELTSDKKSNKNRNNEVKIEETNDKLLTEALTNLKVDEESLDKLTNSENVEDKENNLENNTNDIESSQIAEDLNTPELLLKDAFLSALKNHGKSLQLPLLTSNFYRLYVVPEAPQSLDLKKTKYKKLSNFLNEMIDQGFIVVKEETKGVDKITSIDFDHPDLVNFITDYKKPSTTADGSSDNPLFHSELTELYIVSDVTAPLFTKLNYKRGEGIPAAQIKKIIREYVNKQNLTISRDSQAGDKSYVLDECLQKICNTNLAPLSRIINSVSSQMCHSYQMCNVKDVSGNKPMIQMSLATRSGNKKVTLVSNIECYGIILAEFIKLCKQGAAASTTIVTLPNQKREMLQIQGNQVRFIHTLLTETYKIPPKFILGLELAKDGKKHKKK